MPLPHDRQTAKRPVLTWLLIAVNLLVFLYFYLQGEWRFELAVEELGMVPYYVVRGERLHTLITSMFMHGSWEHILGNMLYLYVFGCPLEARLGRAKFLAFYLVSGVLASLIHIVVEASFAEPMILYNPYGKPVFVDPLLIPCVGASGAISGLLGGYLNLFPRSRLRLLTFFFFLPLVLSVQASTFILMWFLYQLWMGFLSIAASYFAGVAFWAHVGGFVAGWLITLPASKLVKKRSRVTYYKGRIWYEIPVE
ncbi:MAG: rhomboid family intramembrane serine protease [Desulfurococcaceae archaeon]